MDKLEKFIRENRKSLDRYEPDRAVWQRIRGAVKKTPRVTTWRIVSVAATVLVIVGTTFTVYKMGNQSTSDKYESDITELKESKLYYGNQLSEMLRIAQPLFVTYPDLGAELQKDFEDLDQIAVEISADLKDNADNREVIEALILNYRRKVELLEMLLSNMDGSNSPMKKENHEL